MENLTIRGKCRKGTYTDNSVVIVSKGIVCYGHSQLGQPKCEYLEECIADWLENKVDEV